MVTLDAIVLGVVLGLALIGYVRGLLRQLAGIASLVGASLAVGYVASAATAYIQRRYNVAYPWLHVACSVVGWIALYALLRLVLGYVARVLGRGERGEVRPWNRQLGGLFGAAEGLVLCWFIVMVIDAFPQDLRAEHAPGLDDQLRRSHFARFTHRTSWAARLEVQPVMEDLAAASQQPEALQSVESQPPGAELLANNKVAAIVRDPALLGHLVQNRADQFYADPRVQDALADRQVRRMLRRAVLRRLLHQAAAKARAGP